MPYLLCGGLPWRILNARHNHEQAIILEWHRDKALFAFRLDRGVFGMDQRIRLIMAEVLTRVEEAEAPVLGVTRSKSTASAGSSCPAAGRRKIVMLDRVGSSVVIAVMFR